MKNRVHMLVNADMLSRMLLRLNLWLIKQVDKGKLDADSVFCIEAASENGKVGDMVVSYVENGEIVFDSRKPDPR